MTSKVTAAEQTSIVQVFNLKPWGYIDSNDEPQGILVDFFKLIEKESGHSMKIEVVPYKRMLHQISGDTADIAIFSLPGNNKSIGIPIDKILNLEFIAVHRKGLRIDKVTDLYSKTVSMTRGSAVNRYFEKYPKVSRFQVSTFEQAARLMFRERSDAFAGEKYALISILSTIGKSLDDTGGSIILWKRESWLHFSNKFSKTNTAIDVKRTAHNLIKSGEIENLIKQWKSKIR